MQPRRRAPAHSEISGPADEAAEPVRAAGSRGRAPGPLANRRPCDRCNLWAPALRRGARLPLGPGTWPNTTTHLSRTQRTVQTKGKASLPKVFGAQTKGTGHLPKVLGHKPKEEAHLPKVLGNHTRAYGAVEGAARAPKVRRRTLNTTNGREKVLQPTKGRISGILIFLREYEESCLW